MTESSIHRSRFFTLAAFLLCTIAAPAQEQPKPAEAPAELPKAETILDGFIDATGGQRAWRQVKSRVANGTFTIEALAATGQIETSAAAPDKVLSRVTLPGLGASEHGCNGKIAWEKSELTGVRHLDGAERDYWLREATFNADLLWRNVCKSAETVGVEQVNDKPAYKIRVVTREGAEMFMYYDQYTNLLVRLDAKAVTQAGEVAVEVYPTDYREVPIAGGKRAARVLIPHTTTQKMMGLSQTVKFDSIKLNERIPPSIFKPPAGADKPKDD